MIASKRWAIPLTEANRHRPGKTIALGKGSDAGKLFVVILASRVSSDQSLNGDIMQAVFNQGLTDSISRFNVRLSDPFMVKLDDRKHFMVMKAMARGRK